MHAIEPISTGIILGVALFVGKKAANGIRSSCAPSIERKANQVECIVASANNPVYEAVVTHIADKDKALLEKEKQIIAQQQKVVDLRNEIIALVRMRIDSPGNAANAATLREKLRELSLLIKAPAYTSFIEELHRITQQKAKTHA